MIIHHFQAFAAVSSTWQDCVSHEGAIWSAFHTFWLQQAAEVPVLMIRYEDLLNNQQVRVVGVIHRILCVTCSTGNTQ